MKTTVYKDCEYCDGEGGHSEYCCSGMEDGVQSCGCAGYGSWEECDYCKDGQVEHDEVEWDFETSIEVEEHDHEKHYSITGKGIKHDEIYVGIVIYIDGEFSDIVDVELQ
jgi:hypothetical protein